MNGVIKNASNKGSSSKIANNYISNGSIPPSVNNLYISLPILVFLVDQVTLYK